MVLFIWNSGKSKILGTIFSTVVDRPRVWDGNEHERIQGNFGVIRMLYSDSSMIYKFDKIHRKVHLKRVNFTM